MPDRILDWIGFPILGGLSLILVAVVWYILGNRAGKFALILGAVFVGLRQYRETILLKKKVQEYDDDFKAVNRADDIRRKSRDDSLGGKLHEDDGFRRK